MKSQSRIIPLALVAVAWLGLVLRPLYAIVLGGAARAMAGAPRIAHESASGATIHFDIVPFDIPVVAEVLSVVSEAPAGGCAGFLLESFILGRLFPV